MSKPDSGMFKGTMGLTILFERQVVPLPRNNQNSIQAIDPREIRYSQTSINNLEAIIKSMKEGGWIGDPIDVVRMDDGKITTLDNTRVAAARETGIFIKAIIHESAEPILDQKIKDRFYTRKGGMPQTWGDAVNNRIGKQSTTFRNNYPNGSYTVESKK